MGGFMNLKYLVLTFFILSLITAVPAREKIVGGEESAPDAWPWAVALVRSNNSNAKDGQFCGGTLIKPNWVLTAAHCVSGKVASRIDIVLGRHDLETNEGERIRAKRIIAHDEFDMEVLTNDIALIELQKPSKQVPLAYLTPSLENLTQPRTILTVIGYGTASEGADDIPGTLYQVNVPVVTQQVCQASYSDNEIVDSMLCAGYSKGGKDSCQGDSGGPLVVPDQSGRYFLAGVVSWGDGCARPDKYGVYTRVSKFNNWIEQNIN